MFSRLSLPRASPISIRFWLPCERAWRLFFASLKALRACLCSAFTTSRWFRAALAAFLAAAAFASRVWPDVLPLWPLCDFFIFIHHLRVRSRPSPERLGLDLGARRLQRIVRAPRPPAQPPDCYKLFTVFTIVRFWPQATSPPL